MAEPIYVTSIPRRESHELGTARSVRFSNVIATGEGGTIIYGTENDCVENITLDGASVTVTGSPKADARAGNLDLRPTSAILSLFERDIPAVSAHGVEDITSVDGFAGRGANGQGTIRLSNGSDITIRGARAAPDTGTFSTVTRTDSDRLPLGR